MRFALLLVLFATPSLAGTLVACPREGHLPREPAHQIDVMARMLAWFDRWLAPAP